MQNTSVLMTGIGGQGIILASDILADTALRMCWDVKKTDAIGMAQRGGSVVSHIRMGKTIYSPLISEGGADILLGMEKLEAARSYRFLTTGGKALINKYCSPPLSSSGNEVAYPGDDAILSLFEQQGAEVFFIDGLEKVEKLGNTRTLNIFLLGALSVLLPFSREAWEESIRSKLPFKIIDINLEAFSLGREAVENAGIS